MVTRYVNTASTAGGNGTTNETTGTNRAYVTLGAAESALRSSAFADNLEILCCGSVADSAPVTFDEDSYNYVQSAYTIAIRANRADPAGYHGGKWNTATYRHVGFISLFTFECYRNIIIDGIQVHETANGWSTLIMYGRKANGSALVKNCIFKAQNAVGSYDAKVQNISGTFSYRFENCVFYGQTSTRMSEGGIFLQGTHYSAKIYNCVFSTAFVGIENFNNAVAKNCSFQNVDTLYNGSTSTVFDHNATTSGTGTNPITVSNWGDQFYNASYATDVDFRLNTTSVLLGAGIGPALDVNVPLLDILGYSRSGSTATVGPFQYSWDFAPPVADFEGNPTGGYLPLGVTFTDLTTPAPSGWAWNFGDGSPTGTSQYPYHVYTGVGSYTVEMSVWNGVSDTETKVNYINVLASPPIADFSLNVTSGYAPLSVYFTDTSISSTSILSWSWSFGDGYTSTSQNPSHVYTAPGLYTVTLTVVNVSGPDTETKVGVLRVESAEPTLVTYDLAPPQNDDLLAHMPATGDGDTNLYSKGVRYYIRSSVSSPVKSGFRRVSGPTLIFD